MAGTRLAIHATFMAELFLLVLLSFLYASNKTHDPYSSAERFLEDRSGWKILEEDVLSPAPSSEEDDDAGGFGFGFGFEIFEYLEYAAECGSAAMSQIDSWMGTAETTTRRRAVVPDNRPRRASAFVEELRLKIARIDDPADHDDDDEKKYNNFSPPLKVILRVPRAEKSESSSTTGLEKSLAEALERGLRGRRRTTEVSPPSIRVGTAVESASSSLRFDIADNDGPPCDSFRLPTRSKSTGNDHRREVKFPEIVVLTGCDDAKFSDDRPSVEFDRRDAVVVVRTALTFENEKSELLLRFLEEDVSRTLSDALFVPLSNEDDDDGDGDDIRVESVSVQLIDENPASHGTGTTTAAKAHFDLLGRALSSSSRSTIRPLLEDLSFLYGGMVEVDDDNDNDDASGAQYEGGSAVTSSNAINLSVRSSAYVPLPEDVVKLEIEGEGEGGATSGKYVSSDDLAKWTRDSLSGGRTRGDAGVDVEWILFVPSVDNAPLSIRDGSTGGGGGHGGGKSIVLSPPGEGEGTTMSNAHYPDGVSVVDLPVLEDEEALFDADRMRPGYEDGVSRSLSYLVGRLRAIHGLPPSRADDDGGTAEGGGGGELSFWELESIARRRLPPSLEEALSEADSLMALLRRHGNSLALPREVALELNAATRTLRRSVALLEEGFPALYATSLVHGARRGLRRAREDHRLVEPPYFAPDHYLAVFSPLVLPLMLPMIVGLVREVKRFRKLRRKEVDC